MIPDSLLSAVRTLELKPRTDRWTSLTYCVLDAVWSIGARYDSVVVPLVRRVAALHGDDQPTSTGLAVGPDAFALDEFIAVYPTEADLLRVTNAQRTSTRGGITKADAALRYAAVLSNRDLTTLEGIRGLLSRPDDLEAVERELALIPGDGVRRRYLWMLAGSDHDVKPDRMILRYLARHGAAVSVADARTMLVEIADKLAKTHPDVTPWMVDHAIWLAERPVARRRQAAT